MDLVAQLQANCLSLVEPQLVFINKEKWVFLAGKRDSRKFVFTFCDCLLTAPVFIAYLIKKLQHIDFQYLYNEMRHMHTTGNGIRDMREHFCTNFKLSLSVVETNVSFYFNSQG